MKKVHAIFCSDIHLSETAPPARSTEPDWMLAQWRMIQQLNGLKSDLNCPIICAGDVFDRHNPSPALINWAIAHLPKMIAVPGQHDLSHHRYEDIQRSAYWTLVMAGVIENLSPECYGGPICGTSIDDSASAWLFGFPWDCEPIPVEKEDNAALKIAVSHRFVWSHGKGYAGAPQDRLDGPTAEMYGGYDVAVFGDNHQGFMRPTEPTIFNCGCLIRRKANEREYKPRVGLLMGDGHVETHFLDLSGDVWADQPDEEPEMAETLEELREFIAELKDADVGIVDFEDSVHRWLAEYDCSDPVRKILLEVTECQ